MACAAFGRSTAVLWCLVVVLQWHCAGGAVSCVFCPSIAAQVGGELAVSSVISQHAPKDWGPRNGAFALFLPRLRGGFDVWNDDEGDASDLPKEPVSNARKVKEAARAAASAAAAFQESKKKQPIAPSKKPPLHAQKEISSDMPSDSEGASSSVVEDSQVRGIRVAMQE
eukprot:716021-Rhodomonas_salina.1